MPPQHVQWIKPGGPQDVPVTMSDHVQLVPIAVLITHSKGLLHDQLPEEIGAGMVQTRHHRRQPETGASVEVELARVC